MSNELQARTLEENVIIYAESYLTGFNDTLSAHFGDEISEIEKEGYGWPYLSLNHKELGKDVSVAVLCSEYDFYLFFVKPTNQKVSKLLNEIDNSDFGPDWASKTPDRIKREQVMGHLGIDSNDLLEEVHIGGINRFLLSDKAELRRHGESHGRNKAMALGETTVHFLPQMRGQAEHTATLLSFRKEYEALKNNKSKEGQVLTPQQIGHKFENLWRDILNFYGWQAKKITLNGEGNDFTAIFEGHHILGEVRWEKRQLNGEAIDAFAGKLSPRPQTIGIIISYSGFNDGAYATARRLVASGKTIVFFNIEHIEKIIVRLVDPGEVFSLELRNVYDYLFEVVKKSKQV